MLRKIWKIFRTFEITSFDGPKNSLEILRISGHQKPAVFEGFEFFEVEENLRFSEPQK
jgi:hypothetical protein